MLNNEENPLNSYHNLSKQQQQVIQILSKSVNQLVFYRIALSIMEVILLILVLTTKSTLLGSLMLVPVVVFILVVKKQSKLDEQLVFEQKLLKVYQNEIDILEEKVNIYSNGEVYAQENHFYTSDLDVFGKSSLFELVNRSQTQKANDLLAKHLSQAFSKEQIVSRQESIQEMGTHFSDTFSFRACLLGVIPNDIEKIQSKLNIQLKKHLSFAGHKFLQFYVKVVPFILSVLLLLALIFGGKSWSVFGLIVFFNVILTYVYSKQVNIVYHGFSGTADALKLYAKAIQWYEEKDWQSTWILTFFNSNVKSADKIIALSKIITAFDARLNFLLNAFLNFFFLWDLKCSIRLFYWEQNVALDVSESLEGISHFEELISFATLKYNYPNLTFPTIQEQFSLSAMQLGHPLIKARKRVYNDFNFISNPTVDIITGSNMAGKSTFLRTVGINMVLAYAGAPVCAKQMELSIFHLLSYMRIKDNLIESTSTFKAELNRLKMILNQVSYQGNCLVLIDEMLRGTNSKDKFDGSKVFIEKMIKMKIPVLFATHDLMLSELEKVNSSSVRNFHFDIQLLGEEMAFDYQLKQGPCTKFNAAVLLKQIGLDL